MKTNKEILDFYGVELGKKYKITGRSAERFRNWVGYTFIVKQDDCGEDEIVIRLLPYESEYHISVLDRYTYEEVK